MREGTNRRRTYLWCWGTRGGAARNETGVYSLKIKLNIATIGSKIYVRANESNVHRRSVELLNNDIERSTFCRNKGYFLCGRNHFTVVNKFSCGTLSKKIPDSLWGSVDGDEDIPRISLEVAFTHENLIQLYLESVHTLTEYTTMEYAFAIKIHPSRLDMNFRALFFGMRRTPENPPSDPKGLVAEVDQIYQEEKTVVGFDCVQEATDVFPVDDVNAQKNDFGVEVFYTRNITEENYAEDFVVPISPPSDNILIHSITISFIRE